MSNTHLVLPPPIDAVRVPEQYLERNGSIAVMNTYLKIALVCSWLVCVGLIILTVRIYDSSRDLKPLVIRISELGRVEPASYDSLRYQPKEAEFNYFLIQFVQQHYGRMRATVRDNFSRSLYFVDGRVAEEIMEKNRKNQAIETFLSGHGEEIDVHIQNVSIEDLRKQPYRATVDYERIFYSAGTRQENRREKYVGNFVFMVRDQVPNTLIPINPLGLTITYFREDQAFR